MRSPVRMNDDSWFRCRFGGNNPCPVPLPGDADFSADDLANAPHQILEERLWLIVSGNPLPDVEQRLTLLRRKASAARTGIIGRYPMKSRIWQIIVPSSGIAAHEAPWIFSIICCNDTERDEPLIHVRLRWQQPCP